MKLSKRMFIILQIIIALFVLSVPAHADSPMPPKDFIRTTENGKYLFVMLAPYEWAKYQDRDIRSVYKQSGLYKNDGSAILLWPVYWYSFEVYPSSDGKHLARMGPWASSVDDLALSFYRDGQEIKSYMIKDLIRDEKKLSYTVSHFFWRSKLTFDDEKGLVFLQTRDNQTYMFNTKTGEIVREAKDK
jgi:hypothetical protein